MLRVTGQSCGSARASVEKALSILVETPANLNGRRISAKKRKEEANCLPTCLMNSEKFSPYTITHVGFRYVSSIGRTDLLRLAIAYLKRKLK